MKKSISVGLGARKYNSNKLSFIPPNYEKTYYPSVHSCADAKKEGEAMELSYIERKIIQAHREGAKIHVNYHDSKDLDEAIERMKRFGKVTDYKDIDTSKRFYITSHAFENIGVTAAAFLDK